MPKEENKILKYVNEILMAVKPIREKAVRNLKIKRRKMFMNFYTTI